MQLGAPPYGTADLEVWIWGDTIRATNLQQHPSVGDTPRIRPVTALTSERMIAASQAPDVLDAVAALADVTVTGLAANQLALYQELREKIPLHFENDQANFHSFIDTDNNLAIERLPSDPDTPDGYARALGVMAERLDAHRNNTGPAGPPATIYHDIGGDARPDTKNIQITKAASVVSVASNIKVLAEIWRVFNAHIPDLEFHTVSDIFNPTVTVPGELFDLHAAVFNELEKESPTSAPTDNSGVAYARHALGMITR